MSTKDPVEFGKAVLERREQLGLSQIDVWNKRGPSNTTLTVIENGRMADLTPATAKKLDNGLDWTPGSALRLWREGTPPTPVGPEATRPQRRRIAAVMGDAAHISNLSERVEELEFRLSAIEALVYSDKEGGGAHASDDSGRAATNTEGREQYELAADEQEIDPLDEAEETERST